MTDEKPNLDKNATDIVVSAVKGIVGALPYIGALVSEAVGVLIPKQRIERITDFLKILDGKVSVFEQQLLQEKMRAEEFIDLFEDGLIQASRAMSEERKHYIASMLKNSLSREDLTHLQQKKLLSLLNQLNDAEIIILQHYALEHNVEFFEKHEATIVGPQTHLGSSEEEIDQAAVHKTYEQNLVDLGLLRSRYRSTKKGEVPEFDSESGKIKAQYQELTSLGRLLLKYLDLPTG